MLQKKISQMASRLRHFPQCWRSINSTPRISAAPARPAFNFLRGKLEKSQPNWAGGSWILHCQIWKWTSLDPPLLYFSVAKIQICQSSIAVCKYPSDNKIFKTLKTKNQIVVVFWKAGNHQKKIKTKQKKQVDAKNRTRVGHLSWKSLMAKFPSWPLIKRKLHFSVNSLSQMEDPRGACRICESN